MTNYTKLLITIEDEKLAEGRAEGIRSGETKANKAFAHRLQQRGESYDSIASLVNVDVGTVRQWLSGK